VRAHVAECCVARGSAVADRAVRRLAVTVQRLRVARIGHNRIRLQEAAQGGVVPARLVIVHLQRVVFLPLLPRLLVRRVHFAAAPLRPVGVVALRRGCPRRVADRLRRAAQVIVLARESAHPRSEDNGLVLCATSSDNY